MQINVLHLRASTGFGGAENIIFSLCQRVDPERFKVSILATFPEKYDTNFLAQTATALGIPCTIFPYPKKFSVSFIQKFLRYLDDNNIDVIHAHGYRENIMAVVASRLKKVGTVSTIHGWTAGRARKLVDLCSLRFLQKIVAVAPPIYRQLRMVGVPRKKILLLPNFVETDLYHKMPADPAQLRQFGIADDALVVGTAARLSPEKGIADLIRAAELVVQQVPNVQILIVGEGPERGRLIQLTHDLGLGERIVFAGYQQKMEFIYNLFDVYVSPSLQEATPRSVLEAAACELPIVATDVGGVAKVVVDGETGVLTPAGDFYTLAEEIVRLAKDKGQREQFGRQAREWVVSQFSSEMAVREFENLYAYCYQQTRST